VPDSVAEVEKDGIVEPAVTGILAGKTAGVVGIAGVVVGIAGVVVGIAGAAGIAESFVG